MQGLNYSIAGACTSKVWQSLNFSYKILIYFKYTIEFKAYFLRNMHFVPPPKELFIIL